MLKLSIPYTILNAVSTSIMSVALGIKQQEETNTKLKANILKTNTKNAEDFGMKLEDYLKQKEEKKESYFKNLLKRISITDLIEINTKVFQVTKAEESVDITVDDQYIVDCVQVATNLTLRLLKPLADASVIMDEEIEKADELEKRWFEKPNKKIEVDVTIESKVVDPSVVLLSTKEKASGNSNSKLEVTIEINNPPQPFFIDEDHERHINVHSVSVKNNTTGDIYKVTRTDCLLILSKEANTNLKELAKDINQPISVIKAIRVAYNQTPFIG